MNSWPNVIALISAIFLLANLLIKFQRTRKAKQLFPSELFRDAKGLLEQPRVERGRTAGSHRLAGHYRGLPTRVETVVDTLALRKLPSLWVMVTIPAPIPVKSTFDMMMRPTGPTTFSNFDHLPVTLASEPGFPEHALIRTDDPDNLIPTELVKPYLEPFFGTQAKELLITPQGIRIVAQVAEADHARYGVLRQADFGDVVLDEPFLRDTLDRLINIRQGILDWSEHEHVAAHT